MPSCFTKKGLSRTDIIVALDLPTAAQASALMRQIADACSHYKVGLELFAAGEGATLCKEILAHNLAVLVDLKLLDIPATVGRATARLAEIGATALTVHASPATLDAAVANAGAMQIFAVTLLTSTSMQELCDSGCRGTVEQFVVTKAKLARDAGCAGVICSVHEAAAVNAEFADDLIVITPGIRPANFPADDQTRTATLLEAERNGADYAVVGRPIRDSADPHRSLQDLHNSS